MKHGRATAAAILLIFTASAAPISAAGLTVEWDPPTDGTTVGYVLWGALSPGHYTHSVNVGAVTRFDVVGLPEGMTVYFAVQAYNAYGQVSPLSEEVSGTTRGAATCSDTPGVPRLTAQVVGTALQLSWSAGEGSLPANYLLEVGSNLGGTDIARVLLPAAATALAAQAPLGVYFLRLSAINACGASKSPAELSITVSSLASAVPGAPIGLLTEQSGNSVTLSWWPPARGGPASRYVIEVLTTQGQLLLSIDTGKLSTVFTYADTPPGDYVVRIRAANAAGVGAASNAVRIAIPW